MKDTLSLLKAVMSQDMEIFRFKTKSTNPVKKIIFPLLLALLVMYAIGIYYFMYAEELNKVGLAYLVLTIAMLVPVTVTFLEGIYKSQGILFESKDNNLLFSLPIRKSQIIFVRLIKLLVFQYIYNLLFLLPAFVVYWYFVKDIKLSFYLLSFLMTFLLPMIPTALACLLGFFVRGISSRFKAKKLFQTLLSLALLAGIFYLSFNIDGVIEKLVSNAQSINDAISRVYYPIGGYIELLFDFNFLKLLTLILVNVSPLVIIIYLGAINYFKIISKESEHSSVSASKKKIKVKELKISTPITSLVKKELGRYFSSPVYIINTIFGLIMLIAGVAGLIINNNKLFTMFIDAEESGINVGVINEYIPIIYICLIVFVLSLTSITSSSISIEGKTFNLTKSLPIKEEVLLLSKVLFSLVLMYPVPIICNLIVFIKFKFALNYIILTMLITLLLPVMISLIGLLVNLKYPKLNASNDTEVVKQSVSSFLSTMIGFAVAGGTIGLVFKFYSIVTKVLYLETLGIVLVNIVLIYLLKTYGKKRIRELNV